MIERCRNGIRLIAAALIILAMLPTTASALAIDKSGSRFSLNFEQDEMELDYGQAVYTTTAESVYVSFSEPYATRSELGMEFGQTYISQEGNASTDDFYPQGYRLGLWVQNRFIQEPAWHLYGNVFYQYSSARQSISTRQATFTWETYGLAVQGGLTGNYLGLEMGPAWRMTAGKHRITGTPASHDSFTSENELVWRATVKLITDGSGEIGVTGESGNGRLMKLYFSRRY